MGSKFSVHLDDPELRRTQAEVCRCVAEAGGRALLVGGCVRDAALGISAGDLDIEVYGIEPDRLVEVLGEHFQLDLVGRAFGVVKLRGVAIDISIPRRESKAGLGHKSFNVLSDPHMSPLDAARRRDFTLNAVAFDPCRDEIIDPFGGLQDLDARVLRHTSDQFGEDPLRVLRGMQFAARFELSVAPETIALCREIEPEGLPRERIFDEWRKLILLGRRPSLGLAFLRDCGWIRYFPELEALIDCPQSSHWHPEGDVWVHTSLCLDAFAAERVGDEREDLIVGLAVLCHDLGKPATTASTHQGVTSRGHEAAGEELARAFLARLTEEKDLIAAVLPLVRAHLAPRQLFEAGAGDAAVRRLARRVGRIDRLVRVARADQFGRAVSPEEGFPAGDWLLERARTLDVVREAPAALVLGRHLKELGLTPGPAFAPILEACYEAQLEGEIASLAEGVALAKRILDERALGDA